MIETTETETVATAPYDIPVSLPPLPHPIPGLKHIRLVYGADPTGIGFYWPQSAQKRQEVLSVKRGSPADFEAIYQGRPGSREGSIFLSTDLNNYYTPPPNLDLGIANPAVAAFCRRGHMTIQAWDTAFSTTLQSAWSVCVTGLLIPCNSYHCGESEAIFGPCDFHFDVAILSVFRKRIDWGGLVEACKLENILWHPEQIVIEKKASGISLIQNMASAGLPIVPTPAAESKRARAVNSVDMKTAGSVQGWFRQHRVLVPNPETAPTLWLPPWMREMKDFSGNEDSSSDQVDATVHLISRAIRLGAMSAVLPTDWTPERSALPSRVAELARLPEQSLDPRAQFLSILGVLPELSNDPFYGTCGRCENNERGFCRIQNRKVISLDSCPEYSDSEMNERATSLLG